MNFHDEFTNMDKELSENMSWSEFYSKKCDIIQAKKIKLIKKNFVKEIIPNLNWELGDEWTVCSRLAKGDKYYRLFSNNDIVYEFDIWGKTSVSAYSYDKNIDIVIRFDNFQHFLKYKKHFSLNVDNIANLLNSKIEMLEEHKRNLEKLIS